MAESDWEVIGDAEELGWRGATRRPAERRADRGIRRPRSEAPAPTPAKITAADVPLDVRVEIIANAKSRERERAAREEREGAALRAQILAEVDLIEEDRAEEAQLRNIRARGGAGYVTPVPQPQLTPSTVKIGDEPAIYGPGSDFSWFRDRFLDATYGRGTAIPPRTRGDGIATVRGRLARHERQISYLASRGTDQERQIIRSYFTERARKWHGTVSDHSADDWRALVFGPELRADGTGSTSLGTFVPPLYVLDAWQLFRSAAAAAANACGQRALPATGMVVNVPRFSSKVTMAVQETQNTGTAVSTPTIVYAEAPVLTIAGNVPTSQQYMDRVGPGIEGDMVIAEAAAREAGTVLDQQVLAAIEAALPTANKLTNSGSASTSALFADVGKATSLLTTTEGTRLPPTHLLIPGANVAWYLAQVDTSKRPIFTPSPAGMGARNADVDGTMEGYSGYDVAGARMFADENLSVTPHATLLLGNFSRGALVFTGTPIVDVYPTWKGTQLSSIISIRQYAAITVLYSHGFCQITGSAYPASPTFTGS